MELSDIDGRLFAEINHGQGKMLDIELTYETATKLRDALTEWLNA